MKMKQGSCHCARVVKGGQEGFNDGLKDYIDIHTKHKDRKRACRSDKVKDNVD